MIWLKQSTAVDVGFGPFLDDTDGKTAESALTITQPDIRLKKNGGAWAQKNAAQTLTHEENGWYEVSLDATDTDTLGCLLVAVHEAGALPVWREFQVVAANVYDSIIGGGDVLDVSVTQWLGTAAATPTVAGVPEVDITHVLGDATSATDLKDFVDAGYDPTGNTLTDARLANLDATVSSRLATAGYTTPPTVTAIADQVWDEALAGHLTAGSTGAALNAAGAAGDPWSTTIPGAYGAGTAGKIVGDNLNATVGSRSSHTAADIWAVATRALTDKADFSLSAAGIQAIWDALVANLTTVGSIGKRLVDYLTGDSFARLGAPAGASIAADVAAVKAETASIQTDTNDIQTRLPAALVGGRIDASVGAVAANAITAASAAADFGAELADALLNRNINGGGSGTRTVFEALATLRNKVAISAGTITIYSVDDTTTLWTGAVGTAAGNPLSSIDPA